MNLLIINEYFTHTIKSGANIIAYDNYYLMKERGFKCFFYANNEGILLEEQDINKFFPKSHINTNPFLYRLNSLYNIEAKRNLEKVIKKIKPDIVHLHAVLELSYSIINILKKYKIPYIMTIHDAMFVCPVMGTKTHYCTLCSDNVFNCVKNKCSRNNYLNSLYMATKFYINKSIIRNYEPLAIITPSKKLGDYVRQTHSAKKTEYYVVPNFLDKDFEEVTPNFTDENYFLFVGCLADVKGVNILLQAFKELDKNIFLHIVGGGKQEQEYIKYAQNNNLNNVVFLGKLDRQELIKEYKNCIALIFPSLAFESFGMVSIEAFINGKPVIGSNVGGIPEIVEDNINGIIIESNNVEQLKSAILKYWENRDLVKIHGKNAYNKVIKYYLRNNAALKLEEIYKNVAEMRHLK